MRIRKRKMLFPQSSLPDPLVQLREFESHSHPTPQTLITSSSTTQANKIHLHPSDQQQQQEDCLIQCVFSQIHPLLFISCWALKMQENKKDVEEDKKESNDTKNESIYGAESVTGVQPEPSDSSSLGTPFPLLKKRKGSFGNKAVDDDNEKNKSAKSKMKTKLTKKSVLVQPNGNNATEDKDGAKKEANCKGVVLMEGSRCSRVNGRGWRCSQPTLVGYSLCEHHLGKGRLRSMNTVKGKFLIGCSTKQELPDQLLSSSIKDKIPENDNGDEDEDDEPLLVTKKKIKLGMVKAKSISSLLGQTD